MATRNRFRIGVIIAALLLIFFALPDRMIELLWLDSLGFESVFWKTIGIKTGLFAGVFAIAAIFLGINYWVILRRLPPVDLARWSTGGESPFGEMELTRSRLRGILVGAALLIAFFFAGGITSQWERFLRYVGSTPYGQSDPLFGIDLSFYLLELPFVELMQDLLSGLALLGALTVGAVYLLIGDFVVRGGKIRARPKVLRHLGVNLAFLLLAWGWGFYLNRFALMTTPGGVVFGASYTDVHFVLPALWVLVVLSVVVAVVLVTPIITRRPGVLLGAAGFYLVIAFGGLVLVPGIVQQLKVEPNELALEEPYLQNNIDMTRAAYGLDEVETRSYDATTSLTQEQVVENESTLRNIRLWDPRLIASTYRQLQEIRSYYQFYQVDVDRYEIDGEYQQVLLSGRELTQRLPRQSDTWFNRHLQYTHGFGLTMSPVAYRGEEGLPRLLIKDIPPQTESPDLQVDQAAIYYGEATPTYRVVDSEADELHYPKGDDNVYINYDGRGGVNIGGFWRQLLFSWRFSDYNLLLSDYLNDGTRIQFWNRVQDRVRKIAPFLQLDADPYLVLSEGRLVWIQDAYTTARRFPYAEPHNGRLSYIRNSVKIVVDAYHGDVQFYVIDEDDPVLRSYRSMFPELFQPISAMSEDLQAHLRYPEDLFDIQLDKYSRYHMTLPQVFYNNEDVWTRPVEQYDDRQIQMKPYYILSKLPDEERLQFMLMSPLTPANRDNMISWVAAKSDPGEYGELIVYELPKEKLIYGPAQVEARIDQNTTISQQLSLWDQRGSRVIRGNLIVVPIEESFLYVEPVYLIAQGTELPQLRRVIASYGERVTMEPSLEGALNALFGTSFTEPTEDLPVVAGAEEGAQPPVSPQQRSQPLVDPSQIEEARQSIEEAEEALRRGDFAAFGEAFDRLKEQLRDTTAGTP